MYTLVHYNRAWLLVQKITGLSRSEAKWLRAKIASEHPKHHVNYYVKYNKL